MRKRRRREKRLFCWFLVVVVLFGVILLVGAKTHNQPPKTEQIVSNSEDVPPKTADEEGFILNIPMSCEEQKELYAAAKEFGVDYYIMVALIDRETDFRNVKGDGGDSYGYCQIQPKWWYGLMTEIGATDLSEPKDNFRTACAILAKLEDKHKSIEGALVEYNQGYYSGSSTPYSREIMENAERYRA